MKRAAYIRHLRELIPVYGSDNVIYFDESGFEEDVRRDAGWAGRSVGVRFIVMCAVAKTRGPI